MLATKVMSAFHKLPYRSLALLKTSFSGILSTIHMIEHNFA